MTGYESYLVVRGATRDVKLRQLSIAERHAFFHGVLSIAAGAEPRGRLLIGDREATAEDVAHEADVPVGAASRALAKLQDVGVLVDDGAPGLVVRRWPGNKPEPRHRKPSDAPDATRDRKRQSRARHADGSRDMSRGHADEGKGREVEEPPVPPEGGPRGLPVPPNSRRKRDLAQYRNEVAAYAAEHFPDLEEPARSQALRSAIGMKGVDEAEVLAYVRYWTSPDPSDSAAWTRFA